MRENCGLSCDTSFKIRVNVKSKFPIHTLKIVAPPFSEDFFTMKLTEIVEVCFVIKLES